jgi:hypothetical protein
MLYYLSTLLSIFSESYFFNLNAEVFKWYTEVYFIILLAVVPRVAWDFLFDKHINLTYLAYLPYLAYLTYLTYLSPSFTLSRFRIHLIILKSLVVAALGHCLLYSKKIVIFYVNRYRSLFIYFSSCSNKDSLLCTNQVCIPFVLGVFPAAIFIGFFDPFFLL